MLLLLGVLLAFVIGFTNPAWAQEEEPSPFPFALTANLTISVDADEEIRDDVFIGAWPISSQEFTCPSQLSLEEASRSLTRPPPAGEERRLSRKVEQLNWAVGTYRLLGDTYHVVRGDSWTSCQHLSFYRNDAGRSRYYRPAEFLAQEAKDKLVPAPAVRQPEIPTE